MITGELRSKIDKVWNAFWSGGITNPLTVIEQITYLLFIRRLDDIHTVREKEANFTGEPIENPIFGPDQQQLRWSRFKDKDAENMFQIVSQEVFPFMKELSADQNSAFSKFMKGATFMIGTANLLEKVVTLLSDIDMQDRDTKGDLYEYLLSKISSAGANGQFRTPRHIIKMMVEMVKPVAEDLICDPAAGSAGFLVAASEYLREHDKGILHDAQKKKHFQEHMFNGYEFDPTMIRIGAMNLMLHGIELPNLIDKDALSKVNSAAIEEYSLILANPPFKGSLDYDSVDDKLLKVVKTKKTELLFLALSLRLLKPGGRAAVIVPDGVLFGGSTAHKDIRMQIIEGQKLEAIISMPSGVFKPYAGVSTAIMIFTKTNSGGTDQVWFYDMQADGYSLDDKRTPLKQDKHEENNIPDILKRYHNLNNEQERKRTDQSFMVPVKEIRDNNYDLAINRYKEIIYDEIKYDSPAKIISDIEQIDLERQKALDTLKSMLEIDVQTLKN